MSSQKMVKVYSIDGKLVDAEGKRFNYVYQKVEPKTAKGGTAVPTGKDRTRGVHTMPIATYHKILETLGMSIDDLPADGTTNDEILENKISEMVKLGNDFVNNALAYYIANFSKLSVAEAVIETSKKHNK